jgi:hypothetical protein
MSSVLWEAKMSKSSERIKLEAAFFNTVGAGALIAGGIAPAIPFYQNYPFIDVLIREGRLLPLPSNMATLAAIAVWCVILAVICRRRADRLARLLDDD